MGTNRSSAPYWDCFGGGPWLEVITRKIMSEPSTALAHLQCAGRYLFDQKPVVVPVLVTTDLLSKKNFDPVCC